MNHENVLYGPMLSEKYANDFMRDLELCEKSEQESFGVMVE